MQRGCTGGLAVGLGLSVWSTRLLMVVATLAVTRDDLPAAVIQDQVPRELLLVAGEPRVRLDQPDLRLLR